MHNEATGVSSRVNLMMIPINNMIIYNQCHLILAIITALIPSLQSKLTLTLMEPELENLYRSKIFIDGSLQPFYNDTEYNKVTTCTNGKLQIISFHEDEVEPMIILSYFSSTPLSIANVTISVSFNHVPRPNLLRIEEDLGLIHISTQCQATHTQDYYFNKVDMVIMTKEDGEQHQYPFSFVLNCDFDAREKQFEIGYILISLLNSAIMIGVALHSRVWSIRYHGYPLSVQLKWQRFLFLTVVVFVFGLSLYKFTDDQLNSANEFIRYFGLVVSFFYAFICWDEIFFLNRGLKRTAFKKIRYCDLISLILSTGMFILGVYVNNWIYYDILATFIMVGAIKMFRFRSMKQATLSMGISVVSVTFVSVILYFLIDKSYNDFTAEIASPLLIQVPDLIVSLYKKCSWLPVVDVIIIGVFLSMLRTYDVNYNTKWGGVYTVVGNLTFLLATFLWVLLEAVYPYSIPFSLVTYPTLFFFIVLVAYKRNQLQTLWQGRFYGANNQISIHQFSRSNVRLSFGEMIGDDLISAVKVNMNEFDSDSFDDNQHDYKAIEEASSIRIENYQSFNEQ